MFTNLFTSETNEFTSVRQMNLFIGETAVSLAIQTNVFTAEIDKLVHSTETFFFHQ